MEERWNEPTGFPGPVDTRLGRGRGRVRALPGRALPHSAAEPGSRDAARGRGAEGRARPGGLPELPVRRAAGGLDPRPGREPARAPRGASSPSHTARSYVPAGPAPGPPPRPLEQYVLHESGSEIVVEKGQAG